MKKIVTKTTVIGLIFILIGLFGITLIARGEERKLRPGANSLWYYTLQEVEDYYKIHYNRKERLPHYIYQEEGRYIGSVETGDEVVTFEVPNNFIQSMLSHLQQGLEKDWFKFIFWADLNHGHPFLSIKAKQEHSAKYGELIGVEAVKYISNLLLHKDLGILYHAAEHFDYRDPTTDRYARTRNIVGWFDNKRPTEFIYPKPSTETERPFYQNPNTVISPEGYKTCGFINVSAHHNGTFSIAANGKTIRLDISFYVKDVYDGVKYKHKMSYLYPPDGIITDLGIF